MRVEFNVNNEEERNYLERVHIEKLINGYLDEIKEIDRIEKHKKEGDIFERKIAFVISKEVIPPYVNDYGNKLKDWSERLTLEPVQIQEIKLEVPNAYKTPKYNLKQRLKILFSGKI